MHTVQLFVCDAPCVAVTTISEEERRAAVDGESVSVQRLEKGRGHADLAWQSHDATGDGREITD